MARRGLDRLSSPWRMSYIRTADRPSGCLFCAVSRARDDRAHLVLVRRGDALLMLNRFPYNPAHLMVAVRRHVARFADLTAAEREDLMALTGLAERALEAERSTLARDDAEDARFRELTLDALPDSTAGAVRELADYDWRSSDAREAYQEIRDLLGRELLDQRFAGMKQAMEQVTPEDVERIREMLDDLNDLLAAHARGPEFAADTEQRFERFMAAATRISEARLEAKVGRRMTVLVDAVDEDGAECRGPGDAPEIDGNVFIDEGFEDLKPGDMVEVEIDEAGEHDLWGRRV